MDDGPPPLAAPEITGNRADSGPPPILAPGAAPAAAPPLPSLPVGPGAMAPPHTRAPQRRSLLAGLITPRNRDRK